LPVIFDFIFSRLYMGLNPSLSNDSTDSNGEMRMISQSGVVHLCGALIFLGSVPDALATETGTGKGTRRIEGEMAALGGFGGVFARLGWAMYWASRIIHFPMAAVGVMFGPPTKS
jgi:hypothetical protein